MRAFRVRLLVCPSCISFTVNGGFSVNLSGVWWLWQVVNSLTRAISFESRVSFDSFLVTLPEIRILFYFSSFEASIGSK